MKGFRAFLLRGNVIDLAVAVVIGVAFNNIVHALVNDVITPLIAFAGGAPDFGTLKMHLGASTLSYGLFLNAVISFLVIAAVVYFLLVAPAAKVVAFTQRRKEATERTCPECLSTIPAKARRCMYCTAIVPPVSVTAPPEPVTARLRRSASWLSPGAAKGTES
jgi:large conductance mechanosensitive channel